MALQKSKQYKGVAAEYWRLLELRMVTVPSDEVHCVFGLYKDQATRQADPTAILHRIRFPMPGLLSRTGNDTVKNVNIQKAYQELKARAAAEAAKDPEDPDVIIDDDLAFFADAIDV